MRFLEKLRIKKRAKTKLKTEMEIRQRRTELYEIREEWIRNEEDDTSAIDTIIAEFDWILCEKKQYQNDSEKELRNTRRQIRELEEKNRKLQVSINIMRGD